MFQLLTVSICFTLKRKVENKQKEKKNNADSACVLSPFTVCKAVKENNSAVSNYYRYFCNKMVKTADKFKD